MTPAEAEVTTAVRSFEAMSLEALREEWRRRYGAPPTLRSADLVRRMLAWCVQAQALGGLDAKLVREIVAAGKAGVRAKPAVQQGSRLAREWQGRLYEVDVVDGGFVHEGVRHPSLSSVARAITGTRWNGPRFFGLRSEGEAA